MLAFLEPLYIESLSDPVTKFFFWIMASIFAVGLLLRFSPHRVSQSISAAAPNILTTFGILGTFLGIATGLLNFDVSDIDASVPDLLAGLKIAFLTSIIGISASLTLKILQLIIPVRSTNSVTSPDDILAVLEGIRTDAGDFAKLNQQGLASIQTAIASDASDSLLSQVQKLRTEEKDAQERLIAEFRDFAKHMAENNQKALIEALKEVISDFNANLTEQFGENFKELNIAVHKLVEWQDKYREHIETLEVHIETALNALEKSRDALQAVEQHTSAIPEAIKPLPTLMEGLNAQIRVLDQHMESLATLRTQALEAFPVVEENLNKITNKLSEHVSISIDKSTEADVLP